MDFKVGQRVKLVDNGSMVAPRGATAVVMKADDWLKGYIKVVWEGDANEQMDGHYSSACFKPLLVKNQQLLFKFME